MAPGIDKPENTKKHINPTTKANLIFPLDKKMDANERPEILVKTMMELTIISVLSNISKVILFMSVDGKLKKRSTEIAKDDMKKAKRICQYFLKRGFRYENVVAIKNNAERQSP